MPVLGVPMDSTTKIAIFLPLGLLAAGAFLGMGWTQYWSPEAGLERACKAAVLDDLVAPSTASFKELRYGGGGVVFVELDSQNRAGAMLRAKGSCEFKERNGRPDPSSVTVNLLPR